MINALLTSPYKSNIIDVVQFEKGVIIMNKRIDKKKQKRTLVLQCNSWYNRISRMAERGRNTMDLDNNAHSVFLLHYHLVLVVKYRRQVFDDAISGRAKEIFAYIAPNYNITLEEWNHDKDHVHILFKAHPNTEISKFINAYKSASSRLLKKEFPQIKQKLWK